MLPAVESWLQRRSYGAGEWSVRELVAAKGDTRVSVVLPARDERETVGDIVRTVRRELVNSAGLVDELVVMDSDSSDDTARVAARAGARVITQAAVLPRFGPVAGKGEALWKALACTFGDIIVFCDADVRNFGSHFVTGLLGPVLLDETVAYVKGHYERPLARAGVAADSLTSTQGGRVTELVARPLLNLHWPELAGVVQPLAGEYAARRAVLERLPFVTGYGVELGLLLDLLDVAGLNALAQVDLGTRRHTHQSMAALGQMSAQIQQTAWSRLVGQGRITAHALPSTQLTQFGRDDRKLRSHVTDIHVEERPPLITVPEYHAGPHRVSLLPTP